MQKGFLRGRSMLSNVVMVDQTAMNISMRQYNYMVNENTMLKKNLFDANENNKKLSAELFESQ